MVKENLIELYETSFRNNWDLPALTDYFKNETFMYSDLSREVTKLHLLFEQSGIRPGDRVALIGRNTPRWCIAFLATITYGAVLVPILQDFNSNDIQHIVNHCEAKLLFCSDRHWDLINQSEVPQIRSVISLVDFSLYFEREGDTLQRLITRKGIYKLLNRKFPQGVTRHNFKLPKVDNSQVVLINYTSGTTGFTKGVMLTANALAGNVMFGQRLNAVFAGDKMLSFLPLAHAYGCAFEFLYPISMGAEVTLLGKIPAPKVLLEAFAKIHPQLIISVPLVIEKIYRKQILPTLDKNLMRYALKIPLLEEIVYSKIRQKLLDAFGGACDHVIIGGAPFNAEAEAFLKKIKFPFTVGYGMTECAPLITYASPKTFVPGSCGRAIDGMSVKIDSPDPLNIPGEICARGEHLMKGYYKNEKATSDVIDSEGWLHTGDIGTLDQEGNLFIRGRSKNMILRANGQNIYPEEIESKLSNLPCVMEALVVDRGGKLVALVYPDCDQADSNYCGREIREIMDENLKTINAIVAPYEQISEIVLSPNEFEKTPKKSIKRYLYNL